MNNPKRLPLWQFDVEIYRNNHLYRIMIAGVPAELLAEAEAIRVDVITELLNSLYPPQNGLVFQFGEVQRVQA